MPMNQHRLAALVVYLGDDGTVSVISEIDRSSDLLLKLTSKAHPTGELAINVLLPFRPICPPNTNVANGA